MTDGMEGAAPESLGGSGKKGIDPLQHFTRRLVGEGQQQDFSGTITLFQQPPDAVSESSGFATPCPRDDEMSSGWSRDGGQLLFIEGPAKVDRAC